MARSADRLRAGAGAAGEGAPQSGLVTGSATALEKVRREPRNIRAAMEGKGREGEKGGRVWGMDIAACSSTDTAKKQGTKTRDPPQSSLLGFGALLPARE